MPPNSDDFVIAIFFPNKFPRELTGEDGPDVGVAQVRCRDRIRMGGLGKNLGFFRGIICVIFIG